MLTTSQRSLARVLGSAPRYGHEGTGTGIGRGVYLTRGRFSFSTFEHSEPLTVDSLSLTDSTRTPLVASFCCARTDYSSPHAKYLSFQTTTWSNLGSVPVASVIIRRNPSRLFWSRRTRRLPPGCVPRRTPTSRHLDLALRVVLGHSDGSFHVDGCQVEGLLIHRFAPLVRSGIVKGRLRRRRRRILFVNRNQALIPCSPMDGRLSGPAVIKSCGAAVDSAAE